MLLLSTALLLWFFALLLCLLTKNGNYLARILVALGSGLTILSIFQFLPAGSEKIILPIAFNNQNAVFQLDAAGLWLLGFGLFPVLFACIANKETNLTQERFWLIGSILGLFGALGVFGLQDGISFLISWELMSFGGVLMLLAENRSKHTSSAVFFMMSLLEVGAVALLIAILILSNHGNSIQFADFSQAVTTFSANKQLFIGILLLIGFGAKLGILPFYEWLPNAYGSGSGATGVVFSCIILNAAFYGLMRGLFLWLPHSQAGLILGMVIIFAGIITAVLTILQAFQQTDWRKFLSYSSAENAAIAVTALGTAILFENNNLHFLAALAGIVALIQMAAHSLAKGTLFLTTESVYESTGDYQIAQNGLFEQLGWMFGIGALFAGMSLAAMPPQAGFVSEWYLFQTIFQGFNLTDLSARLTLIFAGVGLALTAALALASIVKALGVGLLGAKNSSANPISQELKISIFILGISILVFSVGMLHWIEILGVLSTSWFHANAPTSMHTGLLLVPLSKNFAFISPLLLIIVGPLLAIIPVLFIFAKKKFPIKYSDVWYGGIPQNPKTVATTALTFANAMRTFYRFIYKPSQKLEKEYQDRPYFIKSVVFTQKTTALFSVYLFSPIVRLINYLAEKIRLFQSGNLNFYNSIIGVLFILILLSVFLY